MTDPELQATQLLTLARALMRCSRSVGGGPRAGCLIARQALEFVVDASLERHQMGYPRAPMRTKLICLDHAFADNPVIPFRIAMLWSQLSSACHHHAYELDPSPHATEAMIEDIARLITALADQQHAL